MTRWLLIWTLFSTNCKVTIRQMRELKPYLRRSLTTCPLKYFLWTNAGNTDKSTSQQQFSIFSAELSRMRKKRRTVIERDGGLTLRLPLHQLCLCLNDFTATNFDISQSSTFCDAQVKIFHFPSFNKLQLLRLVSNSVTNTSWSLVYIQHDLRSLNLFSNSW